MTREEAINRLQDAKDGYKQYLTDEAIEMAIKALEQEPCEYSNANQHNSNELNDVGQRTNALEGDVISRQAAIRIAEQGQVQGYEWQFKELNKLPPATPQPKMGKWIDGKCNRCGTHAPFWAMASTYYCSEYCPKCGIKMQADKEI
jgi:hypothetical protein